MSDANKGMAAGLRYPRYVVHWPGIVQVVYSREQERSARRDALIGGIVYVGTLLVGGGVIIGVWIWQVLTHG